MNDFWTYLYGFIHFYTVEYIFIPLFYNSEIRPCEVCDKVNVIKHRKPYKNVYPYIFL